VATWLAVANSRGYPLRVAGAVSTLAMAVLFTLTYTFTQTTMLGAGAEQVAAGITAQTAITAPQLGGLPVGTQAAVAATPGVRSAVAVSQTTVLWPYLDDGHQREDSESALVLPPTATAVLDLDVTAGNLTHLTGATIAVGADTARSNNVTVGSTVALILGDGTPTRATVVAVYARSLGFGSVVVSSDLADGHTTTDLVQALLVRTDGSSATLHRLNALGAGQSGPLMVSGNPRDALGLAGAPPETWVNLATLAVLLAYILLGVANKLVASTSARRRELAVLRLIGTTPGQIRAMLHREAAILTATAVVAGLVLSAIPLALLSMGFLGRPLSDIHLRYGPVTLVSPMVQSTVPPSGGTHHC
jgi:putative ABC transport system permease protein